eukprot:6630904-Pyramimonas_sp.AAC.1
MRRWTSSGAVLRCFGWDVALSWVTSWATQSRMSYWAILRHLGCYPVSCSVGWQPGVSRPILEFHLL